MMKDVNLRGKPGNKWHFYLVWALCYI